MPIIFQLIMMTIIRRVHTGSPSQSGPAIPNSPKNRLTRPYFALNSHFQISVSATMEEMNGR